MKGSIIEGLVLFEPSDAKYSRANTCSLPASLWPSARRSCWAAAGPLTGEMDLRAHVRGEVRKNFYHCRLQPAPPLGQALLRLHDAQVTACASFRCGPIDSQVRVCACTGRMHACHA